MTTETNVSTPEAPAQETERIRAYSRVVKKLGHWTTAGSFDVRAARASVVLDLRSPRIEGSDIEIQLDIDHATVKLLVPDGGREYLADALQARREGRYPAIDDPSR
jgi:hypothetical protein